MQGTTAAAALRLLLLLKLGRLMRLGRITSRLGAVLGRTALHLAVFTAASLMMVHVVACAWYFVALATDDGLAGTWVEHAGACAGAS